jgi:metal-sulfur cluster biosynthetic enzyme
VIAANAEVSGAATVAGEGPPDQRAAVLTEIDTIVDPCSQAQGRPVGLVGMGMIERVDIATGRIWVTVLPTFPTCMFRGVIQEEIESRLRTISWCQAVSVRFAGADAIWDESRLSDAARLALGRQSKAAVARDSSEPRSK